VVPAQSAQIRLQLTEVWEKRDPTSIKKRQGLKKGDGRKRDYRPPRALVRETNKEGEKGKKFSSSRRPSQQHWLARGSREKKAMGESTTSLPQPEPKRDEKKIKRIGTPGHAAYSYKDAPGQTD